MQQTKPCKIAHQVKQKQKEIQNPQSGQKGETEEIDLEVEKREYLPTLKKKMSRLKQQINYVADQREFQNEIPKKMKSSGFEKDIQKEVDDIPKSNEEESYISNYIEPPNLYIKDEKAISTCEPQNISKRITLQNIKSEVIKNVNSFVPKLPYILFIVLLFYVYMQYKMDKVMDYNAELKGKERNAEFKKKMNDIQNYFQKKDYNRVYRNLNELEKISNHQQFYASGQKSLSQFQGQMFEKLKNQHKRLNKKVLTQIKSKNFGQVIDLKNYLNLLATSGESIPNQDLQIFLVEMEKYMIQKIPELDFNASVNIKYDKYLSLKKEAKLIAVLKKFVGEMEFPSMINAENFCQYISKLPSPKQLLKEIKENNENFKSHQISLLWNMGKIKTLSNKVLVVKQLSRKDSKFNTSFQEVKIIVSEEIMIQKNIILKYIKANNSKRSLKDSTQRLNRLKEAEQYLSFLGLSPFGQIEDYLNERIESLQILGLTENSTQNLVNCMIQLKKFGEKIPYINPKVYNTTKILLLSSKNRGLIGRIYVELQNRKKKSEQNHHQAVLCSDIMNDYKVELQIPRIFPNITMSYKYAIDKFQLNGTMSKQELTKQADIFKQVYEQNKIKYIAKGSKQTIKESLIKIRNQTQNIAKNNQQLCINFPKLLANIFTYWSLSKSGEQYYNLGSNSTLLLQPHPIQVLSIITFFGCENSSIINISSSNSKNFLNNHMMQIKTGEGKSVILGVMSTLLGLMDYNVDCVSYSKYLSTRDYDDFKDIFTQLGVSDKIAYGTIKQITSKIMNEDGNVWDLTDKMFVPNKEIQKTSKNQKKKRILLVDEVDTFFSKDFYGATYNPVTYFQNKQINEIINLIWKKRSETNNRIIEAYKNSEHYTKLKQNNKDIISYIDQHFSLMIKDAKSFDSVDYVIQNGMIGYKQFDGVSLRISYGYKTMFAYIYESESDRKRVSVQLANQKKGIQLNCGQFSYTELIPKFDRVLGVTGTLQSLSQFQLNLLDEYNITKKTFAPSVYGQSKKIEKPIIIQAHRGLQFKTIAEVIKSDLVRQTAVLIFFETDIILKQFQEQYAEEFNLNAVTENTNGQQRKNSIQKATRKNCVTLFTAPFGRGTDFVVHDPVVQNVGVTVIQTFLSEQYSEEIQIKGRTARQGQKGKYELILNYEQLSKYNITEEMVNKGKQNPEFSVRDFLHHKRVKYMSEKNVERQKNVQKAKNIHRRSMLMKQKMIEGKALRIDTFFWRSIFE